ncbi:hypothetical protein [Erythrobacter dokdonensis]|uniref:Uncharacterized protein n=1 Tax=Erythrobacter dokdonensis DSW-74 TaxID=1300349 RepID=A0A1A7BFD1_9SPHN|nr:hypothetical protein [Erythrobacter dokdonensis]OBV10117.1 hypothetical protein I603_2678 [Erythrobacter dokdonensis DSW-74]
MREDTDWWDADHFWVRWTHWLPDRASLALYIYTYDEHDRYHFVEEGPFSRWGGKTLLVSPKTMRTRGKLWAQLAADERTLPPVEVSRRKGFYGIACFKPHEVKALLGDAEALTITFYRSEDDIVDSYLVSRATIEAGTQRMLPAYRSYEARKADPEKCDRQIIWQD